MKHEGHATEGQELAALYVLGAMGEEESAAFRKHLQEGCLVCTAEVRAFLPVSAALAEAGPLIEPPASLGARLGAAIRAERRAGSGETQVWRNWAADVAKDPLFVKRRNEGEWLATGTPGVLARQLFVDPAQDRVTMLIRMLPGAAYPAHRHGGAEECYVLSGDLRVGDVVVRTGDYQRVEKGELHPVQSTEGGCLLLITSSLSDEILA